MASITLNHAGVDFPIYNARARSFRQDLLRRVGGRIDREDDGLVLVRALRDITLSLQPGDRLAIMGGNGAGKSTLLRVLAGSYEPSSGSARIDGSVSSLLDITLGMDTEMTGLENIVLRGAIVGLSGRQARQCVPEIAEFSELGNFLHLPVRTYSSGMMLRLAFAISTVRCPDILLLDEVIGVGDADFALKASGRIERLMGDASILALASHNPATLKHYCNRAVLLKDGCIFAEGSITSVMATYDAHLSASPAATAPA